MNARLKTINLIMVFVLLADMTLAQLKTSFDNGVYPGSDAEKFEIISAYRPIMTGTFLYSKAISDVSFSVRHSSFSPILNSMGKNYFDFMIQNRDFVSNYILYELNTYRNRNTNRNDHFLNSYAAPKFRKYHSLIDDHQMFSSGDFKYDDKYEYAKDTYYFINHYFISVNDLTTRNIDTYGNNDNVYAYLLHWFLETLYEKSIVK